MRLHPTCGFALCLLALSGACAAAKPRVQHPEVRQLTVDEPSVVSVPALQPKAATPELSPLPPLGQALETTSPAFQCAFALTDALLRSTASQALAPVPRIPESCNRFAGASDEPRPQGFGAFQALASRALTEALHGPAHERDVSVALSALWLDARLPASLVLGAPPAAVASDPELLHAYEDAVTRQNGLALHGVLYTLHGCVDVTAPGDSAFEPWRKLCEAKLDALQQRVQSDAALGSALSAHRAALRVAAAGERPSGPEACWQPDTLALPPTACSEAASANLAAPWQTPPSLEEEFAGPWPRDHRYGPRDPSSGVRVSLALGEPAALDLRALLTGDVHTQLARCFAQAVPETQPITLALTAQLFSDARGQVTRARLQPMPAHDASAAPKLDKALLRCMSGVLRALQLGCPGGVTAPATLHLVLCLRRD